jgi:hypothetical protein
MLSYSERGQIKLPATEKLPFASSVSPAVSKLGGSRMNKSTIS